MSNQVQIRRGTSAEHAVFTGAVGELTINTDTNDLIIHDGATVGGHVLVKNADLVAGYATTDLATQSSSGLLSSTDKTKLDTDIYTKQQVRDLIAVVADDLAANYYTKSQVDTLIENIDTGGGAGDTTDDLGTVVESVTSQEDYGSVTDSVTASDDYGSV